MSLRNLNILLLLLTGINSFSQSYSIQGKVRELGNGPAIGAAIIFLNPTDSTWIKGTTTNDVGFYLLHGVPKGEYLMKITSLGYKDYFRSVNLHENTDFGEISIRPNATILKQVEVKTDAVIATQSGDTTNYNSKAFKTNKDATAEDLVTKMPGVTTLDGKVQAQGEDVKQVLVDGKPFFGDDPNAVLKNIPAEIIDKVQVFDQKSAQSSFTGFDDGNSTKTINIITKVQFRNGAFGKYYAGYGYEDKYKAGAVINRFKGKQRISFLMLSNNINEQNFSSEDLLGVIGTSNNNRGGGNKRNRSGNGGPGGQDNNTENFLVDIKNGITTTSAIGLNYSDKWGSKTNITAAYFFNNTQNKSTSNLLRQYVIGNNNGQNYNENNLASNSNFNHRINLKLDCKLDSQNSVLIQPRISFQINSGKSSLLGVNTKSVTILSNIENAFSSHLTAYSASIPVLYRHSFTKKGRILSFDLNPTYTGNGGTNTLKNYNQYYIDSTFTDTVDQHSSLTKQGLNSTGNLTYSEPLNSRSSLSVNYLLTFNYGQSEKNTYDRDPFNAEYTMRDTLLSNVFNNQYMAHAFGTGYRFQKEKFNFTLGAAYQYAILTKQQKFPGAYDLTRTFESVLPNAQFQYKFDQKKNLRINYRTSNTPPTVDQLQDVLNNTNSLQLSIGNSELKQNFSQSLNFRYSAVNTEKSTSLFILLNGTYTDNYIGNSTIIAGNDTTVFNTVFLAKGSQISRPINIQNYYNIRSFINYSFALKKIRSNLNVNAGCNYNNVPAIINNKTNYSNTTAPSMGLSLTSNISEQFDFNISSNTSYNLVTNSLQSDLNTTYYNQLSKLKITYLPVKWLVLQSEYTNTYYSGLTNGFNQSISLWNAALGFKFLKDQRADLRLFVFDILGQNNSIQRNTTETYIEDTQTNILQRYYILTFTYNFKRYYEKKPEK